METNQEFHPTRSKYLVLTTDYLWPTMIVIISLLMWWLVFGSNFFAVSIIQCELDFEPCQNASILAELNKYQGVNLLKLDSQALKKRLTGADFTIRTASVSKHLPGTITISLQSVYPTVAAQVKGNPTWVIFDDQLRVIGTRQEDPNVPYVVLAELSPIYVGEKIPQAEVNAALSLTIELSQELKNVKSLELQGTDLILSLKGGRQAIFTTTKDYLPQIRSLQAVLADDTILSGKSTIDVRFSQPVLR